LGVVDGMVKTEHGWWPLCALYESFGQLLIELGQNLDMRGSAFVAGAGSAARIAIAAFFKAGFNRFLITGFDPDESEKMLKDMRKRFFGMEIGFVPMDKIVLLPGECSVAINCTPSVEENALLRELSYLNFLKRPGLLLDLSMGKPNILMQEAEDVGVKVVTGFELAARSDVLWAKWAFQTELVLADYQLKLRAALV
jgi:shikimate 5-dehydrogenase